MNIADYLKNDITQYPNWINKILLKLNIFGSLSYGFGYNQFRKNMDLIDSQQKLLNCVNFAIKYVPYYHDKYGNEPISSINEFRQQFGFIDKEEVMKHWSAFQSTRSKSHKFMTGTTGGTSGKPLHLVFPQNRYVTELPFIHRAWNNTGWKYHTRGVIRNHSLNIKEIYRINPITKEFIFDGFRISEPKYLFQIYTQLKKNNIQYIQAYPSSAYQLASFIKKEKLDHTFIKCFLCSSENVYDYQYKLIEKEMNIQLYSLYGHSEKLIMGGLKKGTHFYEIEPAYGYFELIDKEGKVITQPGIMGEMVGTTFYNHFMPLIRYRTGDYAMYATNKQDSLLLECIQGRWNGDKIYLNDGTFITTTALNLHSDIYTVIAGLQYIQKTEGELEVLIIKTDQYKTTHEKKILEQFTEKTNQKLIIRINYVDNLVKEPNGKFLLLKSEIKNKNEYKD